MLTGVRAIVANIPTENPTLTTIQVMNKFGGVAQAGITCTPFQLDYTNGEFISLVDFSYDANAVRGIRATTNTGNTMESGKFLASHTKESLVFEES